MREITRRSFVAGGLAASAAITLPMRAAQAQSYGGFSMGSQSYSFRNFDLQGAIDNLKALGLSQMEFCGAHFPANAEDPGFAAVKEAIEREARAWLRRHDERAYSFVDATSFAVMRRERLGEALAFDGDFSAAGFVEVRP